MNLSIRVWIAGFTALWLVTTAPPAHAVPVVFTLDPSGAANGLTAVSPTGMHQGIYASGSWLTLSGSLSGSLGGTTASGNYSAQKTASGSFPNGNPGSLTDFFQGTLNVDLDSLTSPTTIAFTGGSSIQAFNYTMFYAAHPNYTSLQAVIMSPNIGGGSIAQPGSAAADYGINAKTTALLGLATVSTGTLAMRDLSADLTQVTPGSTLPLSGPAGNVTFTTQGNLSVALTGGTLDYNLKGGPFLDTTVPNFVGSAPLTGAGNLTTTGNGSLTSTSLGGGEWLLRLSIPVQFSTTDSTSLAPYTLTDNFTGSIAAYAVVTVPEPSTIALAVIGGLSIFALRRRRRC